MQKEYFNILIAGFTHKDQDKIVTLLDEIQAKNPKIDLRYQVAETHQDIVFALGESFYKICLLNSSLKQDIDCKLIHEIQSQLSIQNKTTAIINILTSTDLINNESTPEEEISLLSLDQTNIPELNLANLDTYWLTFILKNTIEKAQLQKEIKRLAHYDSLTGLVNRNLYLNHLNHALALAEREKKFCTLVYLDINAFKKINKKYGVKTGDQVLIECAQRIKKTIRSIDIAARLGSDEFAILLENCHPQEAQRIIVDLRKAMAMPFSISSEKLHIECSIDFASYPDSTSDKVTFLSKVRQAHYLAKTH